MATIRAFREHALTKAEARVRAEALARTYREQLGVSYRWQGDVLHFERPGAKGRIAVEDGAVRVEVKLGWMLRPLRGEVERTLRQHLDEHLLG